MHPYLIAVACLYGAILIAYVAVKLKPDIMARKVLKIALASIYLALAVIGVFLIPSIEAFLILTVCVFTWIGDLLLLFKKTFKKGVAAFFVGHLCLFALQLKMSLNLSWGFDRYLIAAAIFALIYGAFLIIQKTGVCRIEKYAVALNIYIAVVTLNGALGTMLLSGGKGYLFVGLGAIMFMISDYLLGAYLNKWKKYPITMLNSLFYFVGMFLISISCFVF